jgi:hypothetical protein
MAAIGRNASALTVLPSASPAGLRAIEEESCRCYPRIAGGCGVRRSLPR